MKNIYCNPLIGLSAATLGFDDLAGAAPVPATAVATPATAVVDAAQAAASNAMYAATIVRLANRTGQSAQAATAAVPVQGAATNGQQCVRNVLLNQPAPAAGMSQAAMQTRGALQPMVSTATCVRPGSGLVSWWQGEGDATDSMNNNPGVLVNGTSFDSGMVGQAFSFDGSSQSVQIPYSPGLARPSFSVETWVNPQGQPSWQAGRRFLVLGPRRAVCG